MKAFSTKFDCFLNCATTSPYLSARKFLECTEFWKPMFEILPGNGAGFLFLYNLSHPLQFPFLYYWKCRRTSSEIFPLPRLNSAYFSRVTGIFPQHKNWIPLLRDITRDQEHKFPTVKVLLSISYIHWQLASRKYYSKKEKYISIVKRWNTFQGRILTHSSP